MIQVISEKATTSSLKSIEMGKAAKCIWRILGFIFFIIVMLIYGMSSFPNDRAAKDEAKRDLMLWENVLAAHKEKNGGYPIDEQWQEVPGFEDLRVIHGKQKGSYGDLPFRDPWGMDYIYYKPSSSKRYILGTRGPDRWFGVGSDDPSDFGKGDDILSENSLVP